MDCIFYDDGVTGNVSSQWNPSMCTATRESGGYTSVKDTSTLSAVYRLDINLPVGTVIEYDVRVVDGLENNFFTMFYDENNSYIAGFGRAVLDYSPLNTWIHIKCTLNATGVFVEWEGKSTTRVCTEQDYFKFALRCTEGITEIDYKNLKIYP